MIFSGEGKKPKSESQTPIPALEEKEPFPLSMIQCTKGNSC